MAYGLIIEDEKAVRQVVTGYVKAARHTYEEAGSLEEARQFIERQKFDFILLDLKIPFSTDDSPLRQMGVTCLKDIRASELNAQTAVVVVTSDNDNELAMDLRDQGADQYAWKPLEVQRRPLAEIIEKALRMRLEPAKTGAATSVTKPEDAPEITLKIKSDKVTINGKDFVRSLDFQQAKVLLVLWQLLQRKRADGIREGVRASEIAIELGWVDGQKFPEETKVQREVGRLKDRAEGVLGEDCPTFDRNMLIYNKGSGLGYFFGEKVNVIDGREAEDALTPKGRRR